MILARKHSAPRITHVNEKGPSANGVLDYPTPRENYTIGKERGRRRAGAWVARLLEEITRSKEKGAVGWRGIDWPTHRKNYTLVREKGLPLAAVWIIAALQTDVY